MSQSRFKISGTVWNLKSIFQTNPSQLSQIERTSDFWPVLFAKDPLVALNTISGMTMKQNAIVPVTSLRSAQNVLPQMSSLGVRNCLYDIEHWKETTVAEQDGPRTACEKMDNLVSCNKMMLYLSPDFDFTSTISATSHPSRKDTSFNLKEFSLTRRHFQNLLARHEEGS